MPVLPAEISLVGCAVTCSAYAVALTTKRGREFTNAHTEWSVVLGVLLVIGWFATFDYAAAGWMLAFFVAGGTPLILRSYWLRWEYMRSVIDYQAKQLDSHNDTHGGE
jgi:hypothetical protein